MELETKIITDNERALYRMANSVRLCYILEYRRHVDSRRRGGEPCDYGSKPLPHWDGGRSAQGKVYNKPTWLVIVRFTLANQISPILLRRATFRERKSIRPPYPNQFCSPLALQRARIHTSLPAVFREKFKIEDARFKAETGRRLVFDHMDGKTAAIQTLLDPANEISALYRFCVARRGGAEDVIKRFKRDAFQMYVFDRELFDLSWGKRIPRELREAADRFYSEVL